MSSLSFFTNIHYPSVPKAGLLTRAPGQRGLVEPGAVLPSRTVEKNHPPRDSRMVLLPPSRNTQTRDSMWVPPLPEPFFERVRVGGGSRHRHTDATAADSDDVTETSTDRRLAAATATAAAARVIVPVTRKFMCTPRTTKSESQDADTHKHAHIHHSCPR